MIGEVAEDIHQRTPPEWYGLVTPRGWDALVTGVHKALVEHYPDYEVYQIKEKFGGLRYYCSVDQLYPACDIIEEAEENSYKTCQRCGHQGEGVSLRDLGYVATFCEDCYDLNKENDPASRDSGY